MKKVLFETHHLYYWPNFLPVLQELKKRQNYIIHVSMPRRLSLIQQNILEELCKRINISFITSKNEHDRINKILKEA